MDAVERNGYELIPHPANSPDLAPSDFFLFPNLKKDIPGPHYRSNEVVVTAVEEWVNEKDPDFFSSGLMALEHRWSKCITLEGNYIEKEEVDLNRKYVRLVTYWLTLVYNEKQLIYKTRKVLYAVCIELILKLSQRTAKPKIRPVWAAKTQISLYINPVWQGFSFILFGIAWRL